ncbi:MAG: phage head-tail joining protein [Litorimonas sp.]
MTLDELKLRHSVLLAARYSGTRSVSYDGKTVTYGTDAELAAAISDIERRIAKAERGAGRILRPHAVKDL